MKKDLNSYLASKQKINDYLKWVEFNNFIERVFIDYGYQKIITPFLVTSGALESQLEPFDLEFIFGSKKLKLQLPTSPEFHLKKTLAIGLKNIFEIKTSFRNHELSEHHSPEFTMLEFYQNDIDLDGFIQKVIDILITVTSQKNMNEEVNTVVVSISDLFKSIGFKLNPDTDINELRLFGLSLNLDLAADDTFDDIFHRIWLEKIEPKFDPQVMTVVKNYPPSQAALAKINEDGWADRFEIYWKGMELGNAFCELSGSEALRLRWEEENKKRLKQGKKPHPIDHELISLNQELPECCGIAIGLERLFMAIYGFKDINDFKIFQI